MDPEIKDLVLRSRPIVLELLEARGYDTSAYTGQSPAGVYSLAIASQNQPGAPSLKIRVKRRSDDSATMEFCEVVYLIFERIKPTIAKKELVGEKRWAYLETPENTEYIFILGEPYHELFDTIAQQAMARKVRLTFFNIKQLIMNPTKHMLVPKHERVPLAAIPSLKKELNLLALNKLPFIKYHIDVQARWLGLVPGEVVKITRPSPTSGEYIVYRCCSL
jgi:DNA-directed RNA polymerase subunit H (RpoH/RPB5)